MSPLPVQAIPPPPGPVTSGSRAILSNRRLAGLLRHQPLWTVVAAIIVGWGAALLPLGLTDAVLPGLIGFAAGGLIYGPFTAICTACSSDPARPT